MSLRRLVRPLLAMTFALSATAAAGCSAAPMDEDEVADGAQAQTVARPKQFVLLAFDGSYNLSFWRESRAFARQNDLRFSYFISGVYFVPNAGKNAYIEPERGAGKSAIGWGGTPAQIDERFEELRLANAEGHEIASHANSHYPGGRWTAAQWRSEFDQFDKIIFEGIGGATAPRNLGFGPRDVVGFRAPQLAHSPGLFQMMPGNGYAYDTSKSDAPNYWPEKNSGVWNMPLARLRIAGTNRATLSMDYNFYVADSNAQPNPANKERYKRQMVDTYMQYFQGNYFGNRAPVHIGHHFSKWNGGAYWEAMQVFAQRVCGLPEVTCGTYKELVQFLEANTDKLRDYKNGSFTPMPRPPSAPPLPEIELIADDEIAGLHDDHDAHDESADDEE
jgi:peptidoglycan/xylan/chitin deacetylase (PgdA/CDA1 family)